MRLAPENAAYAEEIRNFFAEKIGTPQTCSCCDDDGGNHTCSEQLERSISEVSSHGFSDPLKSIDWGTSLNLANKTLKVFFQPAASGFNDGSDTFATVNWNDYEKQQAEIALSTFADRLDLSVSVVDTEAEADFTLALVTGATMYSITGYSGVLGYMGPPDTEIAGVGVFNQDGYGWSSSAGGGLEYGGFGFVTLIHEFGHGFGLAHPHDTGGSSTVMNGVSNNQDQGTYNMNQGVYSTMTYIDGWPEEKGFSPAIGYGHQGTPMALDVAVLQHKYGWPSANVDNSTFLLPYGATPGIGFASIWDTAGLDTIENPSNATSTIDLREAPLTDARNGGGYVSHIGTIYGGLTIANGVEVENALGGGSADEIYGNSLNNTLDGAGGNDWLYHIGGSFNTYLGGAGNDHVSFEAEKSDFTLTQGTNGKLLVDANIIDASVEYLRFNGTTYSFASLFSEAAAQGDGQAPVFTSPTSASVAENSTGAIYNAVATDTDIPVTYALGSAKDESLFSITSSGALSFSSAPDFEDPADSYGVAGDNTYQVDIIATDSVGSQSTHSLALSVTNINDNAPSITSSGSLSVQNGVTGTVYTASATDADGDTPTFSLGSTKDESLFSLTANGALSFNSPPDYNNPIDVHGTPGDNVYKLDIIASDGVQTDTSEVSITVTENTAPEGLTQIEDYGSVTLYEADAGGAYSFDSGSGTIVAITRNGQPIGSGTYAGWGMLSVEDDGNMFKALWSKGSDYTVWDLSSAGAYLSWSYVNPLDWEDFFQHDFNIV